MQRIMEETTVTGADGGRGVRLPAEGRLQGTSVAEVIWAAASARHTGSLIFARGEIQKVIYLRDGRVVFAASGDPEDRLGTFLLRRGEVELRPLLEASGQIARGRRLGQVLVDNKVLDRDRIVRAILDQVHEIALSVFPWNEGTWKVSRVGLPDDEPVLLEMPAEELVLAGVRRIRDWSRIRRAVGGPRAVYRLAPGARQEGVRLTLTEKAILDQLVRPERVESLCREIYAPSFDVYRSLWALFVLGFVERVDPKLAGASEPAGAVGLIERFDDTARLLLDLGERRFTGVVRFYDGEREGALFLRDGKIEFATSNNPELSLMAHLVRRGVIADRDHEDAVRRLISGKRIGELLAERGAIEPKEIDRFVLEQILEVAKHVALWSAGEYRIEEELPSREAIVLDLSPEELVLAAVESSPRFDPIWERVGGLASLYRLTPGYLRRLDRLRLRPAVWEIVSLLSEERTVAELLDARPEPDFDICRLLAGLALVGVIERVSQEEILARARRQPPPHAVPPPPPRPGERRPEERPAAAAEIAPELFGAGPGREEALAAAPEAEPPEEEPTDAGPEEAEAPAAGAERAEPEPLEPAASEETRPAPQEARPEPAGEPRADGEAGESAPAWEEPSAHAEPEPESWAFDVGATAAPPEEPPAAEETPAEAAEPAWPAEEQADVQAFEAAESWEPPPAREPQEPGPEAREEGGWPREAPEMAPEVAGSSEAEGPDAGPGEPETPAAWREEDGEPESDERGAAFGPEAAEPAGSFGAAEAPVAEAGEQPAAEDAARSGAPTREEAAADWDGAPDETWSPGAEEDAEELAALLEVEEPPEIQPPAPRPDDPARTQRISRYALSLEGEQEEPVDAWVFEIVDRFNERHRIVFQQLRVEIGAGIRNYVQTCIKRLGDRGRVFEGLQPDNTGAFPRDPLARAIARYPLGPSAEPLEGLIETEIGMVRDLLPSARIQEIERELSQLEG